jgi:SagB-type dehydrogenase family enzyme
VKLHRRSAYRAGPFADTDDLNPWLLSLRHMDTLSTQPQRIGFRTSEVRHGNRHLEPLRGIGDEFLVNTRMHTHRPEWDASALEYFSSVLGPVLARSGSETLDAVGEPVSLPDPAPLALPFDAVLDRRRSVREFSGDPIQLSDLATILHAVAGITHHAVGMAIDRPQQYQLHFRSVPSAGGLYGVDCSCVAWSVRGLPPGVYRYRPYGHQLVRIDRNLEPAQSQAAFMQADASGVDMGKVSAALVFSSTPAKVTRKYGDRGVRYLFIEAGMMAFAANLAAAALGWGALDYQSFYEPRVERILNLRSRAQYVLHATLIGWPFGWSEANEDQ